MSDDKMLDLYGLLPAFYRIRDAEQGYPLRALLSTIRTQAELVRQDIDNLWDDLFIETCADWIVPYIGDLVGNNPLYEVVGRRRADVAKTIYYRRRKGTLPMLEEMARDVTGWGVHAVAFFELLGWTQNLNHLRRENAPDSGRHDPEAVDRVGTVNLRHLDALDRLDGPFDLIAHTADVRPIRRDAGWHNIRNIGFFIWRLESYPMEIGRRVSNTHPYGYHFSVLGSPTPLFTNPEREAAETGLATEIHVPGPIRPLALHRDLERARKAVANGRPVQSDYVGPQASFAIMVIDKNGVQRSIPPQAMVCVDLPQWKQPQGWTYRDHAGVDQPVLVGVDAKRGRFVFTQGQEPAKDDRVKVFYHYGFSADIGGGPYDRRNSLADSRLAELHIVVAKGTAIDTIPDAVQQWTSRGKPPCVIQIADNGTYGGKIDIQLPDNGWLVIEAADKARPNVRPTGDVRLTATGKQATLILNGLLVQSGLVLSGDLDLTLRHCTLVPGRTLREDASPTSPERDSLAVQGPAAGSLAVTVDKSIVGPLRLPAESKHLTITDSIVAALEVDGKLRPAIAAGDAPDAPGPATTLERVTVFGPVCVRELYASETIFTASVQAQRRQVGCVRFCYVADSQTPRRYRCQPDLALSGVTDQKTQDRVRERMAPSFSSVHFGDPGYAQLSLTCAKEIRTGAEDGSEMGVFSSLKQPQRQTNLRLRLDEYLPFGLDPGIIYVT